MAKKDKYLVQLPGVNFRAPNEEIYEFVTTMLNDGIYANVLALMLVKLSRDPYLIDLKESPTDIKLSKTIDVMESVSGIINSLSKKVENSVKQINELTTIINKSESNNLKTATSVSAMFDILKSSNEGIEQMRILSEKLGDRFDSLSIIASDPTSVVSTLTAASTEVSPVSSNNFIRPEDVDLSVFRPSSDSGELDDDEDEEDFLTPEQLQEIANQFRQD